MSSNVEKIQKAKTWVLGRQKKKKKKNKKERRMLLSNCAVYSSEKSRFMKDQDTSRILGSLVKFLKWVSQYI